MSLLPPARSTSSIVGRLRIVATSGRADALRAATSRTLEALELRPPGLSPDAILCVRRLADPAPGRFIADRPGARSTQAWREAVVDSLDQASRAAFRPADGPVPASAEAVIFRDLSELLVCRAEALVDPAELARWWWQRLTPGSGPEAVARAWYDAPHLVPAVLDRLARRGRLVPVVRALGEAPCLAIAAAVGRIYAIRASPAEPSRVGPFAGRSAGHPAVRTADIGRSTGATPVRDAPATVPGHRASRGAPPPVPVTSLQGLSTGAARLVLLGLAIHRSPTVAQSPEFSAVLEAWLRSVSGAEETGPHPAGPDRAAPVAARAPRIPTATTVPTPPRRTRGTVEASAGVFPPEHGAEPAANASQASARATRMPASAVRRRATPGAGAPPSAPVPTTEVPDPIVEAHEVLDTRLGGVFFLLDMLLALDLYADFTRPEASGPGLDPWDCVALLARRLDPELDGDDPVWALLDRLAGRGVGTVPGSGWRAPDYWRLPAAWLGPFRRSATRQAAWRWSSRRGRLRVVHPAGFLVLDQAAPGPVTVDDVRRALRGYGRVGALFRGGAAQRPHPSRPAIRRPVDRWIDWLASYAHARLDLALGLRASSTGLERLLRIDARVWVTAAAVDLVFPLAALPIEVRLPGLDRDPGWIPAARRSIRFTFA